MGLMHPPFLLILYRGLMQSFYCSNANFAFSPHLISLLKTTVILLPPIEHSQRHLSKLKVQNVFHILIQPKCVENKEVLNFIIPLQLFSNNIYIFDVVL